MRRVEGTAVFEVEGHTPVPALFVGHGRRVAMALLGVDVYHHGMVDVFDLVESFHETAHIVAPLDVEVVEAEGPK